jgi:hypothetical protein
MKRSLLLLIACAPALWWASVADASNGPPATTGAAAPCAVRASAGDDAVNRAGLVITFSEGRTQSFCVEFTEESITGMELLQRSGLTVVTDAFGGVGAAVCQIDGEGCDDPGNCFCKCAGGTCAYWAYFQLHDGAWFYSPQGSGLRTVRDGDTDGWVWGPIGNGDGLPRGDAPPCAQEPTETPPPVATHTPRPTRTPAPTRTPIASATPPPPVDITPSFAPATVTPVIEVAGATAVPTAPAPVTPPGARTTTVSPAQATDTVTRTPPRTRTPVTGIVRVSPEEGAANARASSPASDDGGSPLDVIAFGVVALALGGGTAALLLRRNRGAR